VNEFTRLLQNIRDRLFLLAVSVVFSRFDIG